MKRDVIAFHKKCEGKKRKRSLQPGRMVNAKSRARTKTDPSIRTPVPARN